MSSLDERLAALSRRLRTLHQYHIDQDHLIKKTDLDLDPTNSKFICTECAWTTSGNPGALARHFTSKHAFPPMKCPDCNFLFQSLEELKKHRSQKHRHLCPGCQRIFATVDQCKHHEPCESQYQKALKSIEDTASPTVIDQPIDGKASASSQCTMDKRGSAQFGSCPDSECQLAFLDFTTLYEHYVGSHPVSIVTHGHSKPFKCPFCSKRYHHDRFVAGHVRTHKPKSLSVSGFGDAKDQEDLIRQSRIAMANRDSESRAEAQAQHDHTSRDKEECRITIEQGAELEMDWSVVLTDGFIYIDGGFNSESPNAEQKEQTYSQQPQSFGKAMPIGIVLQTSSTHRSNLERPSVLIAPGQLIAETEMSDPMDMDDNYPESFALDDHELPSRMSNLATSLNTAQQYDEFFHENLSHEIVHALQMQHFVDDSEVVELFTYFLDKNQRLYLLEEFGSTNTDQHDSTILEDLNRTVFKDLIDAWISFKRLAIHSAPQLLRQANTARISSAKAFTWAVLQYCLNLEKTIYRNETNIAHHFLRDVPLEITSLVTPHAPFPYLVSALAKRVKTRTAHDPSTVFTNEMIFRGIKDYIRILQMVFKPLYPIAAGYDGLWKELGLL